METSDQMRLPIITSKARFYTFPYQKAALQELKVMKIFNIWIFMTKNLKRKKESEGLSAKINPGINMIHLKTYQVLSSKSYYT